MQLLFSLGHSPNTRIEAELQRDRSSLLRESSIVGCAGTISCGSLCLAYSVTKQKITVITTLQQQHDGGTREITVEYLRGGK